MQAEMLSVVKAATASGEVLHVYAEAERIRRNNLSDNLALEDIVDALMSATTEGLAYCFDPGEAADALLGRTGT
jgi:hypothetical protein